MGAASVLQVGAACNQLTFLQAIEHGRGRTGTQPGVLGKFRRGGETFEEENAQALHIRGVHAKPLANHVTKEDGAEAIFPRPPKDLPLQVLFSELRHVTSFLQLPRN